MQYIPYDKDEIYIEKRKTIFDLCKYIWKEYIFEEKNGNEFPEELWNKFDDYRNCQSLSPPLTRARPQKQEGGPLPTSSKNIKII